MERIIDLDEAGLRCRTEQARKHIAEAIACYRASAYRSCIITTWITIVFDLIDKIREISISGDLRAKQYIEEFENYQSLIDRGDKTAIEAALRFERTILEKSRDEFQLLDQYQFIDLERLREDRNRCAHPTFQRIDIPYQPTAELARNHLRNAVTHVLQQQPVQGKVALTSLENLVKSIYFPTDKSNAIKQLEKSALARPSESLVRNFIDMFLHAFFSKGHELYKQERALSALQACLEMHRGLAEERMLSQLNKLAIRCDDQVFPVTIAFVRYIPIDWDDLGEEVKDKIIQFINKAPTDILCVVLRFALGIPKLKTHALERMAVFTAEDLSKAIKCGVKADAVDYAIEYYINVKNWTQANYYTDLLIFPIFDSLTIDNLDKILRSPLENDADLKGSHGFSEFIDKIIKEGKMSISELNSKLTEYKLDEYIIELSSPSKSTTEIESDFIEDETVL